jgi:shikimate kinase
MKITDFFAKHGEDEFRKIESKILKEVSEFEHIVIALGGGTPCFFDNMDLINATGLSIYLKNSEESLLSRLVSAKNNRPLIKDKTNEEIQTFISQTLEKRKPFYEQASIIIENDNQKDANEIVEEIFHSLGL